MQTQASLSENPDEHFGASQLEWGHWGQEEHGSSADAFPGLKSSEPEDTAANASSNASAAASPVLMKAVVPSPMQRRECTSISLTRRKFSQGRSPSNPRCASPASRPRGHWAHCRARAAAQLAAVDDLRQLTIAISSNDATRNGEQSAAEGSSGGRLARASAPAPGVPRNASLRACGGTSGRGAILRGLECRAE